MAMTQESTDIRSSFVGISSPLETLPRLSLRPFEPWHAASVARWIRSDEELHWLAPGTPAPLTADKVLAWRKPAGRSYVLLAEGSTAPIGYGELNVMRRDRRQVWLGHVVLGPSFRGRGLGLCFVRALLAESYNTIRATRAVLVVFPSNDAAIHCYRRAGFELVGEEHHRFRSNGLRERMLRLEADLADGAT